jgi:RHH-type proline utilization regulon transcriptional repressor/proline dehydrogenase/delta 1-pyrroline-5-carboxylate dehydrogenase
LIEENINEIIEIGAKESGKSIKNSIAEIREAVDFCRYYSKEALKISLRIKHFTRSYR